MIALECNRLSKHYDRVQAVNNVSLQLPEHKIYGLIGRNGAGKTTLLRLLTGQAIPHQGIIKVYGEEIMENRKALAQTCFVREREFVKYNRSVQDILEICRFFYPAWDINLERKLIECFELNAKKRYSKLSRGMESMVGIIKGMASRAPITIFDEPSLGLDAAHREAFYDVLLDDYAAHPRTIILSTHLIDEVSKVMEDVLIMHKGEIKFYEPVDVLMERGRYVTGPKGQVDDYIRGQKVIHREEMGNTSIVAVWGALPDEGRLDGQGLDISLIPLQKLFVYLTDEKGGQR